MAELRGVVKGRYLASQIDIVAAAVLGLFMVVSSPRSNLVRFPPWVRIPPFYFVQEGAWSTTLGKRLFGLRVIRLDGVAGSWREASVRTAARLIETNPFLAPGFLAGGIAVLTSDRRQRFGDMLADTVVCGPADAPTQR